MKKLLLVAIIACGITQSFAQKRGFYIGADMALGNSPVKDVNYGSDGESVRGKAYWGASARVGLMFTRHIGVFSGLAVQSYSWSHTYFVSPSITDEVKQSYFGIPIYLHYTVGKPNRIGLFANVGARINFLTNVTTINTFNNTTYHNDNAFSSTGVSAFASTGVNVPLGTRINIDAGPEFQYGMTKNYKNGTGNLMSISGRVGVNVLLTGK